MSMSSLVALSIASSMRDATDWRYRYFGPTIVAKVAALLRWNANAEGQLPNGGLSRVAVRQRPL